MIADPLVSILRAWMITSAGIGAADGRIEPHSDWVVYEEHMPSSGVPDNALCWYETPGRKEGRLHRTGETIIKKAVALRIRGTDSRVAAKKLAEVEAALDAALKVEVYVEDSGKSYILHSVSRGPSLSLGPESEKSRRFSYSINSTVTVGEKP